MISEEQQPYVYLFGSRESESREQPSSELAKFICGQPVELTPELAKKLLHEFHAQDRYRMFLIAAMHRANVTITGMFAENVAGLEHPPTTMQEAVVQGMGHRLLLGLGAAHDDTARATTASQMVASLLSAHSARMIWHALRMPCFAAKASALRASRSFAFCDMALFS